MLEPPDQVFRQRLVLANMLPDLAELTRRMDGASGAWWFTGTWRGCPVRVGLSEHERRYRQLIAVIFSAPIGERPIELSLDAPHATYLSGKPEYLPTGDPELDALYRVIGAPPEVIIEALDAPTRRWILDHAKRGVATRRGGGWLEVSRSVYEEAAGGDPCSVCLSEEQLAYWLDATVAFTDRLVSAYDARLAAIARTQGEAAARAWASAAHQRASARGKRSNVLGAIILTAVLLLGVGVPCACVIAWPILQALLGAR